MDHGLNGVDYRVLTFPSIAPQVQRLNTTVSLLTLTEGAVFGFVLNSTHFRAFVFGSCLQNTKPLEL